MLDRSSSSRRGRMAALFVSAAALAAVLLKRIEVGGFGAGIPAEMDVPTYVGEDGLVHMDEIDSVFPRFSWITSQVNMKELLLNGQPVLEFSELPHHSFVTCEIITQRRLFHLG